MGCFLFWRRRRDLNPRAGYPTYTLSRGASSPLEYFSVGNLIVTVNDEREIAVDFCSVNKNLPNLFTFHFSLFTHQHLTGVDVWRREWDSNPRPVAGSLVFKTSSLNRSDISP